MLWKGANPWDSTLTGAYATPCRQTGQSSGRFSLLSDRLTPTSYRGNASRRLLQVSSVIWRMLSVWRCGDVSQAPEIAPQSTTDQVGSAMCGLCGCAASPERTSLSRISLLTGNLQGKTANFVQNTELRGGYWSDFKRLRPISLRKLSGNLSD
jgi:hypothetical protein